MSRSAAGLVAGRRAVLLDALGTLLELEPPAPRLSRALEERLGLSVGPEDAERAITAEMQYYRAHLDEGRDADSLATLRRRCAEVMGEALVVPAGSPELDAEQLTLALMESLRFSAYPDARPTLAALRERGLRLVVVSNWDVSLPEVLERVGLADRVDAVLTSAGIGARKPAPTIFHAGLEAAGVTAAEAIHVGDGVEEDVGGARGAGIEPVLIARGGTPTPAPGGVRAIRSLGELV